MDLNNIKDPLIKSTILGFISNFGQIPKQVSLDYESIKRDLFWSCSISVGNQEKKLKSRTVSDLNLLKRWAVEFS